MAHTTFIGNRMEIKIMELPLVWCSRCELPAVFNYDGEAYCVEHAIDLAMSEWGVTREQAERWAYEADPSVQVAG